MFTTRDAVKQCYTVPGDDESIIEQIVLDNPHLDVWPPISIVEWDRHLKEKHHLDVQ